MNNSEKRLVREKKTIDIMIHMYCKAYHIMNEDKCEECEELFDYALQRLEKCPQIHEKPTCARCTIHCYNPEKREKIREVMRFSGPRMMKKHPILAVRHLFDMLTKTTHTKRHFHIKN